MLGAKHQPQGGGEGGGCDGRGRGLGPLLQLPAAGIHRLWDCVRGQEPSVPQSGFSCSKSGFQVHLNLSLVKNRDSLRNLHRNTALIGRAMLLNDMEESTRARVEPKEFNSQTMSMLLKFLYTGSIEQVHLLKGFYSYCLFVFEGAVRQERWGSLQSCGLLWGISTSLEFVWIPPDLFTFRWQAWSKFVRRAWWGRWPLATCWRCWYWRTCTRHQICERPLSTH